MSNVEWSLRGSELATCNCAWGCPCQFNARPTSGRCHAAVAMEIEDGRFGDVSLDGLRWLVLIRWPGAIHEGNGEAQIVIDRAADERQRAALLTILSGEQSDPGTFFQIIASTLATVHPPLFEVIELELDQEARTGRFAVAGLVRATAEPIRNPVTGQPHRARLTLPMGFEYRDAEFASSTATAGGPVPLAWEGTHAHFAHLHLTTHGVVQ